jgi:glyoxylase-like metal-dependent hydrolase (beta-lactamase superfamily II)
MRVPQIAPFSADRSQALASLARIDDLDAKLVLPGHGEPWTDGLQSAIAAIRANEAHQRD